MISDRVYREHLAYHMEWGAWWVTNAFHNPEWFDTCGWNAHMHAMMVIALEGGQ